MFRGVSLRLFFTVVFPLALLTTYPARALLGKLTMPKAGLVLPAASPSPGVARAVWKKAIGYYTSASS